MHKKLFALILACLIFCTACTPAAQGPAETTQAPTEAATLPPETTAPPTEPVETEPPYALEKEVVVYFANWYLDTRTAQEGAEVCSIPWDKVTYINHAFWMVEPADGSTDTSWDRLAQGAEPRTSFRIASTLPEADFDNQDPSTMIDGLARNHFDQYAYFSEQYPEVNILISIGGWSRCGYLSEMAYTPEGRQSFVDSCMELMEQHPWIDGYDIDWEYFGGSKDGARKPEDDNDQGCPIWGTVEEDSENFGELAKLLRETMDAKYGEGVKKLTACASASTGWTLPLQNWRLVHPYMDLVNIMTYDMAGVWDKVTGHASRLQHCKDAVNVMMRGYKVPLYKMCIGTPLYGTDLKMVMVPKSGNPSGASVESKAPGGTELVIDQTLMRQWESEAVSGYTIDWVDGKPVLGETFDNGGTGWHMGYDKSLRGAYLWNDDENSEYYKWYISYETALTLQDKLDYINDSGIAGLIVWECANDTYDHIFITQMADNLLDQE